VVIRFCFTNKRTKFVFMFALCSGRRPLFLKPTQGMSEKYKFFENGLFFTTLTVVGWIDVFTRKEYADEIIKNLNYCIAHKGLVIHEFCIMPSHIHLICQAQKGTMSDILRDFKSYSAKQIIQLVQNNPQESRREWLLYLFRYFANGNSRNSEFQFWQPHNHPISLESNKWIDEKSEYIWNNPVKAGIVAEPQHYSV
jgi:putative transposase